MTSDCTRTYKYAATYTSNCSIESTGTSPSTFDFDRIHSDDVQARMQQHMHQEDIADAFTNREDALIIFPFWCFWLVLFEQELIRCTPSKYDCQ